jgi:aryl sulfotransferase
MTARTVWLASFPKSGNTWVRALLTALLEDEELDINRLGHGPIASARGSLERHIGLVSSDLTPTEIATLRPLADLAFDRELQHTRYRKIHDALFSGPDGAPIVPPEGTLGAVYIVRDPRDVAISFAHHFGRTVQWAANRLGDRRSAFQTPIKGIGPQVGQHLGSWSEHVRGWTEQTLFPVIVVRYEDLHADPAAQLERIARMGELEVTPKAIVAAVRATSFDRLREQEKRIGFRERAAGERQFFRRGQSGAWRDELPGELAAKITEEHSEVMHQLGYIDDRVAADATAARVLS